MTQARATGGPRRRLIRSVLAAIVVAGVAAAAPGAGAEPRRQPPAGAADAAVQAGPPDWHRGEQAIAALGERLPAVARAYGLDAPGLRRLFLDDPTLAVDGNGELLYVDHPLGQLDAITPADGDAEPQAAGGDVFGLASRPGADHTIYLDFDGHLTQGTSWNGSTRPTIDSPAYDIDGDPTTFNGTELARIEAAFEAVAEDFAPFDVNVTTAEPPVGDLDHAGSGDTRWGVRVVITDDTTGLCGCGGIAYIGSFDDRVDEPVFVFNTSLTGVVEAISHEVGHAMLLSHDGQTGGTTYYRGHTNGISWGPIMGAAYNRTVTQWSAGEYVAADNGGGDANYGHGADDLAILSSLTNGNGFGYVPDDHGDQPLDASPIGSGLHAGTVSTTGDVDTFVVTTEGGLTATAAPHPSHPNLDVHLRVTDVAGGVVALSDDPATLSASVELPDLAAGTYYLHLSGTGWGDPFAASPSGWTDYGSLGNYTLDVAVADGPVDTEAPAAPTGLTATDVTAESVSLGWAPNAEADLAGYTVVRRTGGAAYAPVGTVPVGTEAFVDTTVAAGTAYDYAVRASDRSGNTSTDSAPVAVTTPSPPPGPDLATGQTTVWGTVTGDWTLTHAADGRAQTLTEASSGGRRSQRHDRAEHRWQLPVTAGNHLLTIEAEVFDGGDADAGFALAWAPSPSGPWTELGMLAAGNASATFDLGSPVGTVHVRVVDTDRTGGNTGLDAIAVDLLVLTGAEPPTDLPGAVTGHRPADGAGDVDPAAPLSWDPAPGATSYRVVVAAAGATVADRVVTETTLDGVPLVAGTAHSWRVDAINQLGTTVGETLTFTTGQPARVATASTLQLGLEPASKGTRRATATVTVVDERGNPVAGAAVTVRFGGDIVETVVAATDGNGVARAVTTSSAKRPAVTACIAAVAHPTLAGDPGPFGC